eukprot:scaffold65430_cov17-Prasinocladus_malaysianus.AAC.1
MTYLLGQKGQDAGWPCKGMHALPVISNGSRSSLELMDKGRGLRPAGMRLAEKLLPVNQVEVESWRPSQKFSKFCNYEWWNLLGMR